ncbi:hypothetical protein ACFO9Q_19825 [Paenibacillus sp. GCM10023252]|uniref:hypothetical protein n=1 Tax=Paenibacillus sp. GCM10023252 TaxID=3252649 RepID=UPI0036245F3E
MNLPYGYELPEEQRGGTLIYYDVFEGTLDAELHRAVAVRDALAFDRLVLYPLHEETVRRMTGEKVSAYYRRADRLHDWKRHSSHAGVIVEGLEGKRKKYTPIDSALRHLVDAYKGPYFLYLTPDMANLFASFSSFEEWIRKLRLVLTAEPKSLHPRLEKYRHRWDVPS